MLEPDQARQMLAILESPLELVHEIQFTRPQRKALLSKLYSFINCTYPTLKR
ncbi:MAG: hypothetical protein IPH31_23190 [Lewinellaceae bacterium]|nr:hypothetical protein [Lewinellaceae bacterium]